MTAEQADAIDEIADICIAGCEAAIQHGTQDMRIAARLLLEALGRELARRTAPYPATEDNRDD